MRLRRCYIRMDFLRVVCLLFRRKCKRVAQTHFGNEQRLGVIKASVYQDGFALLEMEELDVVDICLPTFLNADYLVKAMKYAKNAIVEKPVYLREEEALRI